MMYDAISKHSLKTFIYKIMIIEISQYSLMPFVQII